MGLKSTKLIERLPTLLCLGSVKLFWITAKDAICYPLARTECGRRRISRMSCLANPPSHYFISSGQLDPSLGNSAEALTLAVRLCSYLPLSLAYEPKKKSCFMKATICLGGGHSLGFLLAEISLLSYSRLFRHVEQLCSPVIQRLRLRSHNQTSSERH